MSSRRIFYDEMRKKGLTDRCGYARELYQKNGSDRYKQNCVFNGRCIYVGGIPTREQSYECPIYKLNQERMINEFESTRKRKI